MRFQQEIWSVNKNKLLYVFLEWRTTYSVKDTYGLDSIYPKLSSGMQCIETRPISYPIVIKTYE